MKWIFHVLVFSLTSHTFAQSGIEDSIFMLEESIDEYNQLIDEIFIDLEVLKLRKISSDVREWGLPASIPGEEIVHHDAMSLSYNETHEQANWVVHTVTKDILYGTVSRTNDFRLDPKVSTVTADSADYWDSGFDRGHLAPSADFRWSRNALSQSYFYSNMSPQRPELNRESWARLENLVREFAIDADEVMVVTGPVLHDGLPKIPQGSHRVSIPEFFYKVVIDSKGKEKRGIAFILPNKKTSTRIIDYAVTIDSVEVLTGIDFFPELDDETESLIESEKTISQWPVSATAVTGDPLPVHFEKGQIVPSQAKYYIGEETTVCGTAVSTKFNKNGKANPTYINLDKKFPNHEFTVVIFGKNRMNFSFEPEQYLYGRKICVTGKVEEWKGIPQMIIEQEDAIEVLED